MITAAAEPGTGEPAPAGRRRVEAPPAGLLAVGGEHPSPLGQSQPLPCPPLTDSPSWPLPCPPFPPHPSCWSQVPFRAPGLLGCPAPALLGTDVHSRAPCTLLCGCSGLSLQDAVWRTCPADAPSPVLPPVPPVAPVAPVPGLGELELLSRDLQALHQELWAAVKARRKAWEASVRAQGRGVQGWVQLQGFAGQSVGAQQLRFTRSPPPGSSVGVGHLPVLRGAGS